MSDEVIARARGLIGTRFRAQGRDVQFGLDCVGLVMAAHEIPVDAVQRDYALRGGRRPSAERALAPWFRPVPRPQAREGDVLLLRVGAEVLHLGLWTGEGMVHADIRHGVRERPGAPPWPVLAAFRRRTRKPREG